MKTYIHQNASVRVKINIVSISINEISNIVLFQSVLDYIKINFTFYFI